MKISEKDKTVSLILKAIVVVSASLGTATSVNAVGRAFMSGARAFMYFTIQSNIAVAAVCAIGAVLIIKNADLKPAWCTVKLVATVSITLTGAVFCFILAPTLGGGAWNFHNLLTHVAVPTAAIADYFVTCVYADIKKRSVIYVVIPPMLYAIYAGVGYALNWEFLPGINYPYFFLNWGSPAGAFGFSSGLPFMGCVWWIAALCALLIAFGYAYLAIGDLIKKRRSEKYGKERE